MSKPNIVVLLGMHRSGTSLAMSMLNALGVDCGQALIPAGKGNEEGFWEHAGIVAVQEELLAQLQRVWHGPKGTHPMPAGWLDSRAGQEARARLTTIVEQELKATDGIWGFKDPRTGRLLPLWQQVFTDVAVEPRYILAMRHPAAVSASLAKHNGMDLARSQFTWFLHNMDCIRGAGEKLKLVVDYDLIQDDPGREAARMAAALAPLLNAGPERLERAASKVLTSMRHNKTADLSIANALVRSAYESLHDMARGLPTGADLERQLAEFGYMQQLFLPWLSDTRAPWLDWAIRLIVRRKYR